MAHYLIHLYDYPPIAEKVSMRRGATPRSRRLRRTLSTCRPTSLRGSATGRIDRLQCRIRTRRQAGQLAARSAARDGLSGLWLSAVGAGHQGQGADRRNGDGWRLHRKLHSGAVCRAISPARYAIERDDWKAAAHCRSGPTHFRCAGHPHFARALGAARSGDPAAAKADVAKLAELRDKSREAKDAYWSEQINIQHQVASAWVLYAEGKYDDALKAMSAAADAEDKTEKHPVTPGVPKPARELYGVMLLDRGMTKEALVAFEATLKKEPNRLGAFVGAMQAAAKAGDTTKAREHSTKIVAMAGSADKSRTEIAEARATLNGKKVMAKRNHRRATAARAIVLIGLSALVAPAMAQSLEVHGHAGFLGEWELVGTVTPNGSPGSSNSAAL